MARSSTTFQKGHKHSAESLLKQSLAMRGRVSTFKGRKHSSEAKIRISNAKKGRLLSSEHKKKLSLALRGRKLSEEHVKKVALSNTGQVRHKIRGKNHPGWIKDRTKLKHCFKDERRSSVYVTWRNEVRRRDSFKCKIANEDCSGRLEVHHILGFKDHPELRYDINNGITLCHAHHPKKRAEEKRLIPTFQELVSVSKVSI